MSFPKTFYRWRPHPWHGIEVGENAPEFVNAYIEITPFDFVKYEVDKYTGFMHVDRPQRSSSHPPALYGFIPQTYCGDNLADVSRKKLNRPEIIGDGDPLDICILTEKEITHGDILVQAKPIGGFRMIDGNEADDKIIAVLKGDAVYGDYKDITDCPDAVIDRLKHYFLTYKDMPGIEGYRCEITHIYNKKEAFDVIKRSVKDYRNFIENLLFER
ncbi:MAG: inorganic pyrophosphatase [Bacteroidales bacterium]|nr:inorganic pyrophosphatase [Bacteroidales bacterium]